MPRTLSFRVRISIFDSILRVFSFQFLITKKKKKIAIENDGDVGNKAYQCQWLKRAHIVQKNTSYTIPNSSLFDVHIVFGDFSVCVRPS